MTISYEDVFSLFLGYVNDYELLSYDDQIIYDSMIEYLKKAVSKPYVRRLFLEFSNNVEIMTLDFEMLYMVEDGYDKDFVMDIIAKGMVIEWLQPKVNSVLNTNQFFGTKESQFFSQSNHINQLRGLLDDVKIEQRKIIRDRGYINNDYLEN